MVSKNEWMKELSGDINLSELTIPGTHDTGARYGGAFVECQEMTLKEQLEAGIRFIDIRCRHFNNAFTIHHAAFYQNMNFQDVCNACGEFLISHPSECIIMLVKEEHTADENTPNQTFEDVFDSYIRGHEDFWYLNDSIPTLDEVRRKVVLLRRFAANRNPKGIDASNWRDNATFDIQIPGGTLKIQDQYAPGGDWVGTSTKWSKVEDHLNNAKNSSSDGDWYINYVSLGENIRVTPRGAARELNTRLAEYLSSESNQPSHKVFGTVLMDFPELDFPSLIEQLINCNL